MRKNPFDKAVAAWQHVWFVRFAWVKCQWDGVKQELERRFLLHSHVEFIRVTQERNEMERLMQSFCNELEAAQFWSSILKGDKAARQELIDYYWLVQSVGRVYYQITEGIISSQSTQPAEVMHVTEKIVQRRILEGMEPLQQIVELREEEVELLKEALLKAEQEAAGWKRLYAEKLKELTKIGEELNAEERDN